MTRTSAGVEALETRTLFSTTFVPVPGLRDMVYDPGRDLLYLTTKSGQVQRLDVGGGALLAPWTVGGSLNGAAVTPDGKALFAADATQANGLSVLRKVDLATGGVTDVPILAIPGESGVWDVAVANNGKALVTAMDAVVHATVPQEVDLATGVTRRRIDLGTTYGDTLLASSADGSAIFVHSPSGLRYRYDAATDKRSGHNLENLVAAPAAFSADGSLLAVYVGQTVILDKQMHPVVALGPALDGGLAFDAARDTFYAVDAAKDQVVAYDTRNWRERYRVDVGRDVAASRAFAGGEMAAHADGAKLFLTTEQGVCVIDLPQSEGAAAAMEVSGFSTFVKSGVTLGLTVTVRDALGNVATGYRGRVHFTSTDPAAILPADYEFTAADAGTKTFDVALNTPGLRAITVTSVGDPAPLSASFAGVRVHSGASLIPVKDAQDFIYDPARDVLYMPTVRGVVERYDVRRQTLLAPIAVGSWAEGGDITPDGNFLYVSAGAHAGQGLIRKIDLRDGAQTSLAYPLTFFESVPADVTIAADGVAFVTAEFAGSGMVPLRRIDLATDAITQVKPPVGDAIEQGVRAFRSADYRRVLFPQAGVFGSPFTYDAATHQLFTAGQAFSSSRSAVNRDGTLFAGPASDGVRITDAAFAPVKHLAGPETYVIFSPVDDVMYGVNTATDTVTAYDTDTWAVLRTGRIDPMVDPPVPWAGTPTTGITDDGRYLFVNRQAGVQIVPTFDPGAADAGGPYEVAEGGVVTLDGTRSRAAVGNSLVKYEWDFDYAVGEPFDVDATGATPTFAAGAADGPDVRLIALRVTDDAGVITPVSTVLLNIVNAPPVGALVQPGVVAPGTAVRLTVDGAGDPSAADAADLVYRWDYDADGSVDDTTFRRPFSDAAAYYTQYPGARAAAVTIVDRDYAERTERVTIRVAFPIAATGPSTVQAEEYNVGGAGVAYHDTDAANVGTNVAFRYWEGVDVTQYDPGGNGVLSYVRPGEWTTYDVNVEAARNYDVAVRVASLRAGGTAHLEIDGKRVGGTIRVPDTGAWTTWRTVTLRNVPLPAGVHTLKLGFDTPGHLGYVGDFDGLTFSPSQPPPPPPPPPAYAGKPFQSLPAKISAAGTSVVQAERFDDGGQGVAYHDLDPANVTAAFRTTGVDVHAIGANNFGVGYAKAGEWLKYTIDVATDGTYDLDVRLASLLGGGRFHLELDGKPLTTSFTVPKTNSWTTYQTARVAPSLSLKAGRHVLKLAMDVNDRSGYVANFDAFHFTRR